MRSFGVYKVVPLGYYRALQPWTGWVPQRLLRRLPPHRLGEARLEIGNNSTVRGVLWIASSEARNGHRWPRVLNSLPVVGVEGTVLERDPGEDSPIITNGDALELLFFIDRMARTAPAERPLYKQRMAIGGSDPARVSTTARLLAREISEMVLIGNEPYLQRVAGHILAETGLAVGVCSAVSEDDFDRIIWCGEPTIPGISHLGLFRRNRCMDRVPWTVHDDSPIISREIATFSAAEAMLLTVAEARSPIFKAGRLSVGGVEQIAKIQQEMGFGPKMEALDTPPPVGYNDNNF